MQLSACINSYGKCRHRADLFKKVSAYIHAKSSKCTPNLHRNWASKRAEYSRFRCRKVIQHCGKLSSTSFSWADFWFYWHYKTVPHKNNKGKIYLFAKRSSSSEILKQFNLQSSVPWKTCPVRREKNLSSVLSLTQEALLLLGCRSQREALSKPFIHTGMFSQFFSREARVGKKKQCKHEFSSCFRSLGLTLVVTVIWEQADAWVTNTHLHGVGMSFLFETQGRQRGDSCGTSKVAAGIHVILTSKVTSQPFYFTPT